MALPQCSRLPLFRQVLVWCLVTVSVESHGQKILTLDSPSGKIQVSLKIADSLYYRIEADGTQIISESAIALLTDGGAFGIRPRIRRTTRRAVSDTIINPVPFKRKKIPDHFHELAISFRGGYGVAFRAYDDGVAWRFITSLRDSIKVIDEIVAFRLADADSVYFSRLQKRDGIDIFHTSFEENYTKAAVSEIQPSEISYSPLLAEGHFKTVITESALFDYPGMYLRRTNGKGLRGIFAAYPKDEEVQGDEFKQPVVTSRQDYIAKTNGSRLFPWRVIVIAKKDADLLLNDLVYRLGSPPDKRDWSWVKPGISTEEWICGINLHHVNFMAGINTASYKYYIDFASRFGMQYVMLDAGWSAYDDLLSITPGLDLKEVAAYAKSRNVGLILWTLSMTLDRQLEEALTFFNTLGVKVIMTDFMDRDDQKMVRFYRRIAEATAAHHIMVMFHGAFKNAGFERTYPHAITREAVLGSEYNIWSDKATPEHDLLIPFIRMVAGPMDYEPGFYVNVNKETFRPLPDHVMSQGTRCHQLAMFVAYDSPLQMFSGNPSDALEEPQYTSFLLSLPTTWDDTVVPDAELGNYLVMARQKGDDWFLAAMTDWSARDIEVDLSFLGPGHFRAQICEDGINAAKFSGDYRIREQAVDHTQKLRISMAPGGGYVAKIIRQE